MITGEALGNTGPESTFVVIASSQPAKGENYEVVFSQGRLVRRRDFAWKHLQICVTGSDIE